MKLLAVIVAVLGLAWLSWTSVFANPAYTFRYKLTIEVDVHGRRLAGSSVVEVTQQISKCCLHPGMLYTGVDGEATAIDLGSGQMLVALLDGVVENQWRFGASEWKRESPAPILARLHGIKYEWHDGENEGLARLVRVRGVKELSRDQLPVLLLFRDKTDPKSAAFVNPTEAFAGLRNGARISRVTIEITDAPVTRKIDSQLPWLSKVENYLSGKLTCSREDLSRPDLPLCPMKRHLTRKD